MDADAKKTALRMIPYGIDGLTAESADGTVAAATVNWVTLPSFDPPLVAIGVKSDSGAYGALREARNFALNFLGKGQQGAAFTFFKPAEVADGAISGEPYTSGANGAPLLTNAIASVECKFTTVVEQGDHHIIVGEVTEAKVNTQPEGRADDAVLHMGELGDNVFYGG